MADKTAKKTPAKPPEAKAPEADPNEAQVHASNPAHNHGPMKKPGFDPNRFGGGKPKSPPFKSRIVRGANRGR